VRVVFLTIGIFFLVVAGLFHVYVFILESINWLKPKTWKLFGLPSLEVAKVIQPMAFNQGFYNLFLAVGILIGAVVAISKETIGLTLMLFAASSMVGAGVVLFLSVKRSRRAALLQALPPLIGIVLTVTGLASK
jgi:putative membrane protein